MIRRGVRDAILAGVLWLVPVMLLIPYGRSRPDDRPLVPADSREGYSWLALPAVEAGQPGWIAEWGKLSVVADHDVFDRELPSPVPDEAVETPVAPDAERPFRIRLAGQVLDGRRVLYCFFDTEDQRWFRIAGGGVDPEAGIRLETDPGGGPPLVTDLVDGARYVLLAGETRLERIGFKESLEPKEPE